MRSRTITLMARIDLLRAWHSNSSAVQLDDVSQPCDKITPAMQQVSSQRSPSNLVRIILGLPELLDAGQDENVYTRAARDFRAWRRLRGIDQLRKAAFAGVVVPQKFARFDSKLLSGSRIYALE